MSQAPPVADLERLRRRTIRTLFGGAGLGSIPFFAVATAAPITLHHLTGSQALTGLSVATLSIGTGIGAVFFSEVMARRGRRVGLMMGYLVAVAGSVAAAMSLTMRSLAILLFGILLLGAGHSSNQLARFAAGELAPAGRRASAVSLVVWAGTAGAVIGPNILTPFGRLAEGLSLDSMAGAYLAGILCFGLTAALYFIRLRPDPSTLAVEDLPIESRLTLKLAGLLAVPRTQVALISLALSQFVMVLIMTVTPVHIQTGERDLTAVGVVLSAHYVGMFALSPLAGWFSDRFGKSFAIWVGFGLLIVSAMMVAAAPAGGWLLAGPLFLVGLGWSLAFVSGSALLTEGMSYTERTRLQGSADTAVWTCSAAASLVSGFLLSSFGYSIVGVAGGAAAAATLLAIVARRKKLALPTD